MKIWYYPGGLHTPTRSAGSQLSQPPKIFSRKERKERKEMEGGNGESEANEVTLPLEPLRGC